MQINDFLSLVAQGLLIIALPIVIAAAIQTLRVQSQKLGGEKLAALRSVAETAVKVAEQTGLKDQLLGPEKRDMAIQVAQDFLKGRGINMDLDKIVAAVEAEVHTQFRDPTTSPTSSLSKQELIDRAVETAVLAAEQSGLQGTIQNVGPEKKMYALQMAGKYLEQHGIQLPEDLAGGLIEAQLLRFRMQARGQGGARPATPVPAPAAPAAPQPKG
jgi:hypothetical protein